MDMDLDGLDERIRDKPVESAFFGAVLYVVMAGLAEFLVSIIGVGLLVVGIGLVIMFLTLGAEVTGLFIAVGMLVVLLFGCGMLGYLLVKLLNNDNNNDRVNQEQIERQDRVEILKEKYEQGELTDYEFENAVEQEMEK